MRLTVLPVHYGGIAPALPIGNAAARRRGPGWVRRGGGKVFSPLRNGPFRVRMVA